jgi:hypothetical protein
MFASILIKVSGSLAKRIIAMKISISELLALDIAVSETAEQYNIHFCSIPVG